MNDKSNLNGYLAEDQGHSSTRLSLLICTVFACVIGLLAVILGRDLVGAGILVGALMGTAVEGKVRQKRYEYNRDCKPGDAA